MGELASSDDDRTRDPVGNPSDDRVRGCAPPSGRRVLRAVRVPRTLLLIGVVLLFVGPVPGLAAFLVVGDRLAP